MNTFRRILLTATLALTFLAATSSVVVAATTYEYKAIRLERVSVKNAQQLELLLNQLGAEGWLLIQITGVGVAVLQREK
jgi:P pilus assembly chaperone PapD